MAHLRLNLDTAFLLSQLHLLYVSMISLTRQARRFQRLGQCCHSHQLNTLVPLHWCGGAGLSFRGGLRYSFAGTGSILIERLAGFGWASHSVYPEACQILARCSGESPIWPPRAPARPTRLTAAHLAERPTSPISATSGGDSPLSEAGGHCGRHAQIDPWLIEAEASDHVDIDIMIIRQETDSLG